MISIKQGALRNPSLATKRTVARQALLGIEKWQVNKLAIDGRTTRMSIRKIIEISVQVMFPNLQGKVKSISATEAAEKVKKGKHVLVDVRTREAFEQAHPEGAVNIPLYKTLNLQEGGPSKWLKYLAYAANGVSPIELNTTFDEELKAAAAGKGIITICDAGGSLKPTVNFPQGKASRSLQAAYIALTQGLTSGEIIHLDKGLYGWYQEDGEIVGEYKPDIGRTPMAAQDPTLARLSAETGYEMRPGDKR